MKLSGKHIEILKVAEKLFAENGFDGTSIRQIAKEADINIAMVSYYFGSKEKLLEAIISHRMEDFRLLMQAVFSENLDYLDKVDKIVAEMMVRVHNNRMMHTIIHSEFLNSSRNSSFDKYIKQKHENYKLIEDFIIGGQNANVFSKNVDIQLIIPTILGSYFHFLYNIKFFQERQNLSSQTDIDQFVHNELTKHVQRTLKALLTYED